MNKKEYLLKIKTLLYAKDLIKSCSVVPAYGEMFIIQINETRLSSIIFYNPSSIVVNEVNSLMLELDIKEEYLREIHESLNSLMKNSRNNDFLDLRYQSCSYDRFLFERELISNLQPQNTYNIDATLSRVLK